MATNDKLTKSNPTAMVGTIKSFRYSNDWCLVTVADATTEYSLCIGHKADYPFATMLTLKGQQLEFSKTDKVVNGYERYAFKGFAL
jgi:hypothetical protein